MSGKRTWQQLAEQRAAKIARLHGDLVDARGDAHNAQRSAETLRQRVVALEGILASGADPAAAARAALEPSSLLAEFERYVLAARAELFAAQKAGAAAVIAEQRRTEVAVKALEIARSWCASIVGLAAGYDTSGATGPRQPLRWETVARMALDYAAAALAATDSKP